MAIAELVARTAHGLGDCTRARARAVAQVALGEIKADDRARVWELLLIQPLRHALEQGDPFLGLARFGKPESFEGPRRRSVEGDRRKRQRLVAVPHARLSVAPQDMGRARPPQADDLQPEVVDLLPVLETPAAIAEASLPLADRVAGHAEPRQRSARPPDVAARREEGESALAGVKGDFSGNAAHIPLKVKVDVTEYDRVLLPVQTRRLIHQYSDASECSFDVRVVKLEEALADKMKCLIQRRYAYDLFDLVYGVFVNRELDIDRAELVQTFLRKTIFEPSPVAARDLLLGVPFDLMRGFWSKVKEAFTA